MRKTLPSTEHVDTLSLVALRKLVSGLVESVQAAQVRLEQLETENKFLRQENAELRLENTRLKVDNQFLRDEIARLKNLPPRPPFRRPALKRQQSQRPAITKPIRRSRVAPSAIKQGDPRRDRQGRCSARLPLQGLQ